MNASLLYIDSLENSQVRSLMSEAHELIIQLIPQIQPVFKWKTPFFDYYGSYFCYLNKHKDHIYLSFLNKRSLLHSDTLEIIDLKSVSKVYIKDVNVLRSDGLSELIIQAAVIHESMCKK